jgi:exopolyphosphatase/guanosine-5'-triphosphate,3'-diphosphate pyrophosphatase
MTFPLFAAGVDVGTNSVLLTLARRAPRGPEVLEERCVVTRLGQGLGAEGRLSQEAMDRTVAVLEEFGAAIMACGARARAAGTSALRRATNRDEFLERAQEALRFPLEVLSGPDEARLGYRGAISDLPGVSSEALPLVVDPGGGSTEVFRHGGQITSLEAGAVRLTEGFLHHDPPSPAQLEALTRHARAQAASLEPAAGRPVVTVGGTATTLAALSAGLRAYDSRQVHGRRLTLEEIRSLRVRLAALPLVERERIPCLSPGRADIIVAGALLLEVVLTQLAVEETIVSDRGLRYGLIAEIMELGS